MSALAADFRVRDASRIRAVGDLARRQPGMVVGFAVVATFLLAGLFAPLPFDPETIHPESALLPPSSTHWFGTDNNGIDVFSRVIASARLDVTLALAGGFIAAIIGVPLGLLASAGTRTAGWIMQGLDVFQSFPLLVLAIVIVSLTGSSLKNVVFAIALIETPRFIRLVRSQALTVRAQRYVEAAVAIGASGKRVTFRHVLPNVTATIFAQLSLAVGQAILVIAALSFLGVGIKSPTPSWGAMIRTGSQYVATGDWWLSLFPGLAILVFVVSFNAIAEGLEASLRPD